MEDNPTQQPEQIDPTQTPQSPFRRWLPTIIGITIVVLAVGGFSAWQFFQAPEDGTETWTLYTDSPFGNWSNNAFGGSVPGYELSLKIPPNFQENEGMGLFYYTGGSFSIMEEGENKNPTVEFQVSPILLADGDLKEEAKELITKYKDMRRKTTLGDGFGKVLKVADINLSNCVGPQVFVEESLLEYKTFCSLGDDLGATTIIFVLRADYDHRKDLDKYKPLYDKILSTFKYEDLTKKSDQDETANWRTYRNEEFGFAVKYPDDWQIRQNSSIQFSISEKNPSEIIPSFKITISNGTLEQEISVLEMSLDDRYGERILNKENVTIAGGLGVRVVYSTALGVDFTKYFVVSNNPTRPQTYSLELSPGSSVHSKILSTFKFTD